MTAAPSSFAGIMGVARADITPPTGIYARSWGAAAHDVAQGLNRPLTITCFTLQENESAPPLVLITADLGWWKSRDDERFVRDGVLAALNINEARLLFCLSHTHAGPSLARDDADRPGGEKIGPYLTKLREAASATALAALANAQPATLTWRYGRCDLATNRDLPDAASGRWLVGFNPHVPADDTLLVGRATGDDGTVLATLVNYACHPTTLAWENGALSPDYPGAMREIVEHSTGAPCLFLQGASGELAPAEQYSGETALSDQHGRRLGHAVLATLAGMLPPATSLALRGIVESGASLAIWRREPNRPLRTMTAARCDVTLALKAMPTVGQLDRELEQPKDRLELERLRRQRAVRRNVGDGDTMTTALHVWRLGEALLFAHPHEAYSVFQVELRRRFSPRPVAAINIANGYASYLPPRSAYEHAGLYAVTVSPFLAGGLERLMAAAIALGDDLTADADAMGAVPG
jgi:hypothetical protein